MGLPPMLQRHWLLLSYLQAALLQIGTTGARLMVSFSALAYTHDPLLLGLVAATYAAPAIMVAVPVGSLADRWGAAPVVVVGVLAAALACSVAAFAANLTVVVLANLVLGAGQLLTMVGQQGHVAERLAHAGLDAAYGNLTSAMSIGQFLGPLVVITLATRGAGSTAVPDTTVGLLACVGALVLALPAGVGLATMPRGRQPSPRVALRTVARDVVTVPGMWRALLVSGVVLGSVDLLVVFLPAWGAAVGISAFTVGLLLGLRALVTLGSRLSLGMLTRTLGRQRLLAW